MVSTAVPETIHRFEVVFQQILGLVYAPQFEIVRTGPLGFALDLIPTVEDSPTSTRISSQMNLRGVSSALAPA
jgi:hypothetical protein